MQRQEIVKSIREKIRNLKSVPGCYLWKDEFGEIIYIGKAADLQSRTLSYLQENKKDYKTSILQGIIHDLDWIVTATEKEALLLEATLIKKHNPKYNVRLKDDKKYPFICITLHEMYPRIFLTRKTSDKRNKYLGPYINAKNARDLVRLVHKIFPIRKRNLKLPMPKPQIPCLNFHIGRCLGPCTGSVDELVYKKMIRQAISLLEGKKDVLIHDLKDQMDLSSERMDYETAARYRDILYKVNEITERQAVVEIETDLADYVGIASEEDDGQLVVLQVREGRLENKMTVSLQGMQESSLQEIYTAFIRDYYLDSGREIPSKIYFLGENFPFDDSIDENIRNRIVFSGSKSRSGRLLLIAEKNARYSLTERLSSIKSTRALKALSDLKEMFHLRELPKRIEGYDVSHLSGTLVVASGVYFLNGEPLKSRYRCYTLKEELGNNDPIRIHEVIARRFQRLLNEGSEMPNLVVIDGGREQLKKATEAMKSLDILNVPIVSLAKKREEVYFPDEEDPFHFDPESSGMLLLRKVRDEAHRFAVSFQRKKRIKPMLRSALDALPEIGAKRRGALQKFLLETEDLSNLTAENFRSLPGFGPKLSDKIIVFLRQKKWVDDL